MREILFRGKRTDNGEWVEGNLIKLAAGDVAIMSTDVFDLVYVIANKVDPSTVGQFTGLYDKNGKRIFEGDVLRFSDYNGIWQAAVVFERGLFGLEVCNPKQIQNPDGWDMPYDRVKSRWWGSEWGYEEYGTAFMARTPLAKATVFSGSHEEYQNSEMHKWHEEHGWGKYAVWAECVGNIHDNPELLEGGGEDG